MFRVPSRADCNLAVWTYSRLIPSLGEDFVSLILREDAPLREFVRRVAPLRFVSSRNATSRHLRMANHSYGLGITRTG